MDPQDKIDLSSVNQQPKAPRKLPNPFRKKTKPSGPNRDHLGQFSSGSGGLKAGKKFNWKLAVPLVAVVALAGGYMVYRSFAAGWSGWVRTGNGTWTFGTGCKLLDEAQTNNYSYVGPTGSGSFQGYIDVVARIGATSNCSRFTIRRISTRYSVIRFGSSKGDRTWTTENLNGTKYLHQSFNEPSHNTYYKYSNIDILDNSDYSCHRYTAKRNSSSTALKMSRVGRIDIGLCFNSVFR